MKRKGKTNRASANVRRRAAHSGKFSQTSEEWKALVDRIDHNTRIMNPEFSGKKQKVAPYDRAESFLKREIYRFVCKYLDNKREILILDIFEEEGFDYLPKSPTFKDNPFHWALAIFRGGVARERIKSAQVSRFGRQLSYARRHRIPPELLIGFLYQAGHPDEIYRKARNPDTFEPWSQEFLSRVKNPKN